MRLELPARRDAIESARQALLAWLAPHQPSPLLVYRSELVLEEVMMNIIWHAYPEDGGRRLWIEAGLAGDELVLRFEDEGVAFDPTSAPNAPRPASLAEARVGGLGLALVRSFARAMTYRRGEGRNRLEVVLAR